MAAQAKFLEALAELRDCVTVLRGNRSSRQLFRLHGPRGFCEDAVTLCATPILSATEESLWHKVMFRSVGPPFYVGIA